MVTGAEAVSGAGAQLPPPRPRASRRVSLQSSNRLPGPDGRSPAARSRPVRLCVCVCPGCSPGPHPGSPCAAAAPGRSPGPHSGSPGERCAAPAPGCSPGPHSGSPGERLGAGAQCSSGAGTKPPLTIGYPGCPSADWPHRPRQPLPSPGPERFPSPPLVSSVLQ